METRALIVLVMVVANLGVAIATNGAPSRTPTSPSTHAPATAPSDAPTPALTGSAPAAAGVLGTPTPAVSQDDLDRLRAHELAVPVVGVAREDLHDSFDDLRGLQLHEGIDLAAPAGTPVAAVEDGTVAKLFVSLAGGLTIYQFDPESTYAYYYAHLDRYADGLYEGRVVKRGEVIGYVGTTGNARGTAHLHFAIFKLGPQKLWWEGSPINPYLVLRGIIK
jgi:murein DD-endopeptidase MepM/ murein hydrolase activator NlpD